MAPTYLDEIVATHRRRAHDDRRSWRARLEVLEAAHEVRPSFAAALAATSRAHVAVIAEVKRRSPSQGWIKEELDVAAFAHEYQAGGASAISVLTDETYFAGSMNDLALVRRVVTLPLLRKDFTVSENDVLDAVEAGASAVLIIVAVVDDGELASFLDVATRCGIDALVEVHDDVETSRANDVGARIIGVNQRDLRTFEVDVDRAATLVAQLPHGCLSVCESGIASVQDVEAAASAGFNGVLVGEAFVRARAPRDAVQSYSSVARP